MKSSICLEGSLEGGMFQRVHPSIQRLGPSLGSWYTDKQDRSLSTWSLVPSVPRWLKWLRTYAVTHLPCTSSFSCCKFCSSNGAAVYGKWTCSNVLTTCVALVYKWTVLLCCPVSLSWFSFCYQKNLKFYIDHSASIQEVLYCALWCHFFWIPDS